jgi:ABC-type dipeptide/oligopeptide/nickel transport system permease subunit
MAAPIGISAGINSAYRGGKFDLIFQRAIDMLLGFPFLVLALIMIVALKTSSTSIAIAIALALAPQIARVSRASALSVKGDRPGGAAAFSFMGRNAPGGSAPIF